MYGGGLEAVALQLPCAYIVDLQQEISIYDVSAVDVPARVIDSPFGDGEP